MPPKTGHFSNTAYSMPGTRDVDAEERLAGDDRRVVDAAGRLADDLVVLRILQLDRRRDPAACSAARLRRELAVAERAVARRVHHLAGCGRHSAAGTFHVCAAAATSICRRRRRPGASASSCSASRCCRRRPARRTASGRDRACSTRTSFQSTSSSSAMIIGSIVLMPWPISGFFAMIVTMPSGAILMNELAKQRSRRRGCRAPARIRRRRLEVAGDQHAAAGERRDAQEGAAIERWVSMTLSPYSATRSLPVGRANGLRRCAASRPRGESPGGCAGRSRSGRGCRSSPRRCRRRSASDVVASSAAADMICPAWQ